jgi:putative phosphoribosyl transferase
MQFTNRENAARLLVEHVRPVCEGQPPLVLGVPRGGVPMAKIIREAVGGELDVVLVHKLGHPDQPELAIGAIDEAGNAFLSGWATDVDPEYIEREKRQQLSVLRERRAQYTPRRQALDPRGRVVIIVDDGIATGSTITAALRTVCAKNPKKLILAVAVASKQAAGELLHKCDALVCLSVPAAFSAVGQFFDDFDQVSDQDVIEALRESEAGRSRVA